MSNFILDHDIVSKPDWKKATGSQFRNATVANETRTEKIKQLPLWIINFCNRSETISSELPSKKYDKTVETVIHKDVAPQLNYRTKNTRKWSFMIFAQKENSCNIQ